MFIFHVDRACDFDLMYNRAWDKCLYCRMFPAAFAKDRLSIGGGEGGRGRMSIYKTVTTKNGVYVAARDKDAGECKKQI